jgi:pimeloyl-ACP methyl ester carboxylesterase
MNRRDFLRLGTLALLSTCVDMPGHKRYQRFGPYKIQFTVTGDASLPPLLFLHGMGRPPSFYSLGLLKEYQVFAPEIYGMDVGGPPPQTISGDADLTAQFCKSLNLSDAHIIGQSTGATIPWMPQMQEFYKDLVSVDPILPIDYGTWGFVSRGLAMNRHELFGSVAGWRSTKVALRDIRRSVGDYPTGDRESFAEDIMNFDLKDIKVDKPVLLLHGEKDELFALTPQIEEDLRRSFSRIQIKDVRSEENMMNHEWMVFYPELAYKEMREFHR